MSLQILKRTVTADPDRAAMALHLVEEMRKAQREYFAMRDKEAFKRSKNLEKEVDTIMAQLNDHLILF